MGRVHGNGDQGRRSGSENLPEWNEQSVRGGAGRVCVPKCDCRIANAVRKLGEPEEGNYRKENRERHGSRSNDWEAFCQT